MEKYIVTNQDNEQMDFFHTEKKADKCARDFMNTEYHYKLMDVNHIVESCKMLKVDESGNKTFIKIY